MKTPIYSPYHNCTRGKNLNKMKQKYKKITKIWKILATVTSDTVRRSSDTGGKIFLFDWNFLALCQIMSPVSKIFDHRWSNFDRSFFLHFCPSKSQNSWFLWSRTLGFPWSSRIWAEVDFHLFKSPKMAQNTPKTSQNISWKHAKEMCVLFGLLISN